MANTRRIGFRGDDRPPEQVFREGFQARSEDRPVTITKGYATESVTAVSFSWRPTVATMFPYKNDVEETWIYAFAVDLLRARDEKVLATQLRVPRAPEEIKEQPEQSDSDLVYLHGLQYINFSSLLKANDSEVASYGLVPLAHLWTDELAIKKVDPQAVLFAVKCRRIWTENDEAFMGGHYRLVGEIKVNKNFSDTKLDKKVIAQAKAMIQEEVKATAEAPKPMPKSHVGIHRVGVHEDLVLALEKGKEQQQQAQKELVHKISEMEKWLEYHKLDRTLANRACYRLIILKGKMYGVGSGYFHRSLLSPYFAALSPKVVTKLNGLMDSKYNTEFKEVTFPKKESEQAEALSESLSQKRQRGEDLTQMGVYDMMEQAKLYRAMEAKIESLVNEDLAEDKAYQANLEVLRGWRGQIAVQTPQEQLDAWVMELRTLYSSMQEIYKSYLQSLKKEVSRSLERLSDDELDKLASPARASPPPVLTVRGREIRVEDVELEDMDSVSKIKVLLRVDELLTRAQGEEKIAEIHQELGRLLEGEDGKILARGPLKRPGLFGGIWNNGLVVLTGLKDVFEKANGKIRERQKRFE